MEKNILTVALILFSANVFSEELKVSKIFSDNMVLQRGQVVKIWGEGKPDALVDVTIENHLQQTTVNGIGEWFINLPEMSAGGPYSISITSNEQKVVFSDVLIGDVWIASGQSNMEWKLDWQVNNTELEKSDSVYPNIRYFELDNRVALDPIRSVSGSGWKKAGPQTVGDFSAVAWFFAKHNHIEKDVPVGIIDSTWGGTPAEAWTPLDALLTVQGYEREAEGLVQNKSEWLVQMQANTAVENQRAEIINSLDAMHEAGVHLGSYDHSNWGVRKVPFSEPENDVVWLRKKVTLNSQPKNAVLSFGELNQLAWVYVNGTLAFKKAWLDKAEPIVLDADVLQIGENVISLRVINDWNNMAFVGKPNEVWLKQDGKKLDLSGDWFFSNSIEPEIPQAQRNSSTPTGLYNAMIHPLLGLSMKGVIWYQGESNVERASEYHELFSTLIKSWRQKWGRDDFPFLYVQLASFLEQQDHPHESAWATLREQQAKALSLPNTGMAVTIDIGEADDIHPRNKQDVGKRLWLLAKHVAFGHPTNFSGPTLESSTPTDRSSLLLEFKKSKPLKVNGQRLLGFELAAKDGVYHRAVAKLIGDYKVEVSAERVSKPVSVRYAWADNSPANLYDGYDLPAVPFRYGELAAGSDSPK